MKRAKKVMSVTLSMVMALSMAGCGSSGSSTPAETKAAAATEAPAAGESGEAADAAQQPSGEPIKIGFFSPRTSAAASADG